MTNKTICLHVIFSLDSSSGHLGRQISSLPGLVATVPLCPLVLASLRNLKHHSRQSVMQRAPPTIDRSIIWVREHLGF